MRVIDVLKMLANDEEIPEYINYYDSKRQKKIILTCEDNIIWALNNGIIKLNDEVWEETTEDKKIEKLELIAIVDVIELLGNNPREYQREALQNIYKHIRKQEEKLNEIIDELNRRKYE